MLKNLRSSYKFYKKESNKPVDLKKYLLIATMYNKFLIKKVIEGEEVVLPSRLGSLRIIGRKQKVRFDENGKVIGLAPDWVKTKKLWDNNPIAKEKKQLLYHTNEHTDSVRYKFLWSKNRMFLVNKMLYALQITRHNKRQVHKKILEGKEYREYNK